MAVVISPRLLDAAIDARLKLLPGLTVYPGEAPSKPPAIESNGEPDPSGRVAAYAVIYGGAGRPVDEEVDLADTSVDLRWPVQVTVVAGYKADCLHQVGRVHGQLFRWAPTVAGVVVGQLRPPPGFDPGFVRRDDDVSPPRFYLPLLYTLTASL